ncbi:MAG TPA: YIP1 family protein [Candidatus Acidoferrum sp.]|nr:YIP1 family protein [Candidatus Acidoferrum sp.]
MATTTAVPPAAPEAQPQMSAISRLVGVLFSPQKTFEDIVRKPSWLAPIVVLTILSIAVSVGLNQRVNWRDFIGQQIDKSPQAANLTPEQRQQRIDAGAKFAPISTYVFGTAGPILFALIIGLIMWGVYSLLGGISTNFSTAFGITSHAFMTGLVSSPLFLLIIFLKAPGTIDMDNPVASNVAALLPDDAAKWLVAFCKSLDIFTIWTLILLAIGFAAVNPKKLKGGKTYAIAFGIWAAFVVCRVGWAFIFS